MRVRASGRRSEVSTRRAARVKPFTDGTCTFGLPVETVIVTFEFFGAEVPCGGILA